ncbi:MAG: hypothetical protein ACI85O_002788 [Saprospiraceae bacterium]|jgi:hypothetical protein
MKEFLMLFRTVPSPETMPTGDALQVEMTKWQNWIGGIAAQGKFIKSNELDEQGRMVNPGKVVTDGPYAEVKEIVGGYIIVKAENYDEAVEMAHGCPSLEYGGSVEVRLLVR